MRLFPKSIMHLVVFQISVHWNIPARFSDWQTLRVTGRVWVDEPALAQVDRRPQFGAGTRRGGKTGSQSGIIGGRSSEFGALAIGRWERAAAAVRHYDVRRVLAGIRRELASQTAAMATAMRTAVQRERSRLDQLEHQIKALSPVAILERGYALVFDSKGKLVKNSAQVETGDEIAARLAQGTLTARVEKKS